jgi:hypothetical protein
LAVESVLAKDLKPPQKLQAVSNPQFLALGNLVYQFLTLLLREEAVGVVPVQLLLLYLQQHPHLQAHPKLQTSS